jgi:hypothetical protein
MTTVRRMASVMRPRPLTKDIRAVLRAQTDMAKVIRVLRPVVHYKGL